MPVFGGPGAGGGTTARGRDGGRGPRLPLASPLAGGSAFLTSLSRRTLSTLRAPREACLPPTMFLGSIPTGKSGAMCVSFSPDGALLAIGCADDLTFPVRSCTGTNIMRLVAATLRAVNLLSC